MTIEENTNQLLRSKYFVGSGDVVGDSTTRRQSSPENYSRIINASNVSLTKKTILLQPGSIEKNDKIKVNVIREKNNIKGIAIICPCGRHAELDFEYTEQEKQ